MIIRGRKNGLIWSSLFKTCDPGARRFRVTAITPKQRRLTSQLANKDKTTFSSSSKILSLVAWQSSL
jgi:hypothetical protein